MELKRMSWKHKNNKTIYYLKNYLRQLMPTSYYNSKLQSKLENIDSLGRERIIERVNYYNKMDNAYELSSEAKKLSDLKLRKERKVYFFDLFEYGRYFKQNLKGLFLFGDITHVPEEPSFVKSRPIHGDNRNSVVLKLGKVRHFTYIKKDKFKFRDKKDMIVGRGKVGLHQPHRLKFMQMYYNHPMCNVGKVNHAGHNPHFNKNRLTISEHLKYKFILSLEGNDVASNLKWVMSSNSLAVMPKPKFETWFMEGSLIPDHHYVLIKDDYSDLEEKMKYYIDNPDKAEQIIKNANEHVAQFRNKKMEDIISLCVIGKYFNKTNQIAIDLN